MARIDDYLVIQLVGTRVVMTDDRSGSEVVLLDMSERDSIPEALTAIMRNDELTETQVALIHFWCGYFYAHVAHQTVTSPSP